MITMNRFLFSVVMFLDASIAQAAEIQDERAQAYGALSDVVESNCMNQEDHERAGFLKEVSSKIQDHLSKVTSEMRDAERFAIDPREAYIRSVGRRADETAQKIKEAENKARDLRFEIDIEKHAVAVYSNFPQLPGELGRRKASHAQYSLDLVKTNRSIASLKGQEQADRAQYEQLSAAPEKVALSKEEADKLRKEHQAKLPELRNLAGKFNQLKARAGECLARAENNAATREYQDAVDRAVLAQNMGTISESAASEYSAATKPKNLNPAIEWVSAGSGGGGGGGHSAAAE